MSSVSVAAGAALVLLVAWDIGLTVLHPAARGPLSYAVNRAVWSAVRSLSLVVGGRRLLSFAGPLAMGSSVAAWVTGLWVGFALIYAPFGPEPLYLSAESVTTVGFGDHVPSTAVLRLVAAFEAGAGLGAFTAAIAFVLSVYPLVTAIRAGALHMADLGATDAEHAARLVAITGDDELSRLHADLIECHEHVRRFPILYYFESGDEHESFTKLLRGGCVLVLVLRWGVDGERFPAAGIYAPALERTMDRLLSDLESDFVGGRRGGSGTAEPQVDPEAELATLRAAVRRGAPGLESSGADDLDAFAAFVARAQRVMRGFAREHLQDDAPLIDGD